MGIRLLAWRPGFRGAKPSVWKTEGEDRRDKPRVLNRPEVFRIRIYRTYYNVMLILSSAPHHGTAPGSRRDTQEAMPRREKGAFLKYQRISYIPNISFPPLFHFFILYFGAKKGHV